MRVTNTVARILAAGAGLLLASAGLAQSPGYPDRPVKIIVPFAAAGADRRGGPAHHAEAV